MNCKKNIKKTDMFSRYDVYTTVQSVYCYIGSDVLKNKLGIRDKEQLKTAEENFSAVKQLVLIKEPINGRFTKNHLFKIHKFMFCDVYSFAGHIRREQISKGDTMFYPPSSIDKELNNVFNFIHTSGMLEEKIREKQIQNLSYVMARLNEIHPFREGNGRSIREFIRCMALNYGLQINWGNTDRENLIKSSIKSIDDTMAFVDVLNKCII